MFRKSIHNLTILVGKFHQSQHVCLLFELLKIGVGCGIDDDVGYAQFFQ